MGLVLALQADFFKKMTKITSGQQVRESETSELIGL
jgi:hypothetical protein